MSSKSKVKVGQTLKSRTGREYAVTSVDDDGFVITRCDTQKSVRITNSKIEACRAMLQEKKEIKFQQNPKDGGFSYTVAIEVGVVHALRKLIKVDAEARVYRLKGTSEAKG